MATVSRETMTATDSQGKVIREARKDKDEHEFSKFYWWKSDEKTMPGEIVSTIKFIQEHQQGRLEQLVESTRLYGTSSNLSLLGMAYTRQSANTANPGNGRVSFNLCASVVDTLQSKIGKNKVIPTFVTNGGTWGMQKKSRDLSKFIEGCFYEHDVHSKGTYAFRDAAVWGTGLLHICEQHDDVYVEKVYPHEIFIDTIEALATEPQQMHRVKIIDRDILASMFQDDEEALECIMAAMPTSYQDIGGSATAADLVTVYESWHLKSGPDAKDGLHTICLDDTLLFKEEWNCDYFPFVPLHYSKNLFGYWGKGACERLAPLQIELNKLMVLDQRSRWMMASFKILVENGSKVVSQHLNNDVGTIIHYTGTPPQYITPPPIDPGNEAKIDSLIAKGYQQEGVSQLAASSLKPLGLDSGKALRAFDQIEEDRQYFIGQEVERFYLEVARQMIEVAKKIYSRKKTFEVVFPSTRFMETVDWKDIKLKDDEYVLKAFPVSSLADDMAGRLQEVQELAQAGMISPRTARKLMRTPDLEMSDNLANAAEDLLCKMIEEMIDTEDASDAKTRPDFEPSYMDMALGRQLTLEYYNYAKFQNAPDDVLARLQAFLAQIDEAQGFVAQAMQPPPQLGAPGGQPPANPTAPPVSPLIPNINQGQAA